MDTNYTTRTDTGLVNVHRRTINAKLADSQEAFDSIATSRDRVWPRDRWPRIWFGEHGPKVGAEGGHGPIRYRVTTRTPGKSIEFAFTERLTGGHRLELAAEGPTRTVWTHTLFLTQPNMLLARIVLPLHDACLEDLLDQAEAYLLGHPVRRRPFPLRIRLRRALLGHSREHVTGRRGKSAAAGAEVASAGAQS